ncbi:hypothetical protein [Gemmata sp.]|uniref:hypothetical protein n=1 Tax=Gemmata sp. TaxID=1914242 RepID=UPI003F6F5B4F
MTHLYRPLVALAACALLVAPAGCSRAVHPVKGTVRFKDGTPLTVGRVVVDSDDGKSGSWGAIRPDGTFEMGTLAPNDGVPAGTYRVYLTNTTTPPPADLSAPFTPKPLVNTRFNDKETSGVAFEVPRETTWEIVVEKP